MTSAKFLGVFLNPVLVQSEGVQPVFDNLESLGVDAIATVSRVAKPASNDGVRFPDLHVDGHRRLLGRPVWGQHEIQLDFYSTFEPNLALYESSGYQPATSRYPGDGDLLRDIIDEAHERSIAVHLQTHPFLLPGIRPSEQPVYVDGQQPLPPQVNMAACPSNPRARQYGSALVTDTLDHYSDVDGLFTDWAEYGAYALQDHFACFCPHCERQARAAGYDWKRIRHDVTYLWDKLHAVNSDALRRWSRLYWTPSALVEFLAHFPGILDFLRFKADAIVDFYRGVRRDMDEMGLGNVAFSARGWPPPWNRSSGMNYRALAGICNAVTPKLFLFDYSAIPRWYGETLQHWNPSLQEGAILEALLSWLDLPSDLQPGSFERYRIPPPHEQHPVRLDAYAKRIEEVVVQVGGNARCYPFAHAYLPAQQWCEMVALVRDSDADGMWVQMYGYLSDEKMEILKEEWLK